MRHGLDAIFQRFVKLAQCPLGFALLRDVRVGTKPPNYFARVVADWESARQKPAIVAIPPTQRKRILPRCAAFKTLFDALDDAINMVRVMDFLPAPTLHLFRGRSGVIVPAFVVPVDPAGMVRGPCKLADVIGKLAETTFACA